MNLPTEAADEKPEKLLDKDLITESQEDDSGHVNIL